MTVSLDSVDDQVFRTMNDVDFSVERVLAGIDAAARVGLAPVKINVVIKRGVNEHSILPLARYFRGTGHILRFIEYMDVGHSNGWRLDDVVPAAEVLSTIRAEIPVEPIEPNYRSEVADRWRYRDGSGEIGIVASVTQPFCRDCTRARLSADGELFTCLFATRGHDLRALLRGGASDGDISDVISGVWAARSDRYSEIRSAETVKLPKVEMSYVGDKMQEAEERLEAEVMDSGRSNPPHPFPESLCHQCGAPPRYIRTETSVFILCPVLPNKYPPQPVLWCPQFQPREGDSGNHTAQRTCT